METAAAELAFSCWLLEAAGEIAQRFEGCAGGAGVDGVGGAADSFTEVGGDERKAPAVDELPHLAVLQAVARAQPLDLKFDVHLRGRLARQHSVVERRVEIPAEIARFPMDGMQRRGSLELQHGLR